LYPILLQTRANNVSNNIKKSKNKEKYIEIYKSESDIFGNYSDFVNNTITGLLNNKDGNAEKYPNFLHRYEKKEATVKSLISLTNFTLNKLKDLGLLKSITVVPKDIAQTSLKYRQFREAKEEKAKAVGNNNIYMS
ncbi:MAG: hypothetical protein KC414_13270, partial [Romboutsia sp.]|nr:hypothetical protein [Romboutsia sp.]